MGPLGVELVVRELVKLKQEYSIDLVVAQGENVDGKGMSLANMDILLKAGVNFFTGGNHTPFLLELHPRLLDPQSPVIAPANVPSYPGVGYKYITHDQQRVLIISVLGSVVGSASTIIATNPLQKIDTILTQEKIIPKNAILVNFHGDFSSEKVIIGHYLDGRVSAVIGDHWHVPTADARLLPKGTAHISDVGMCGALNSSLGVELDCVVGRWKDGAKTKNILEKNGPLQLNAVIVETNTSSQADSITQIQKIYNN